MFRPAQPTDTPALLAMTAATNVFKPMEVDTLGEVLDDYHAHEAAAGARCFVLEQHDELVGFAGPKRVGPGAVRGATGPTAPANSKVVPGAVGP